jgi:hypothetical protein
VTETTDIRQAGLRESDRRVLRWVSWLIQGQGVLLSAVAIGFALYALGRHKQHHGLAQTEFEFGLLLLAGLVLLFAGRALGRGSRAAYSPLLLLELICLPVAWGLAQGHRWGYAALVGASALVVVIALFSPAGRRVVASGE